MKPTTLATMIAAATLSVAVAMPAEAARKRRNTNGDYVYYSSSDRSYWNARSPTRLTVRRRSYLDPGTETKQFDEHYADYAFSPGNSFSYQNRHNYNFTFNRSPLPDPWDMPGWTKF